MVAGALDGVATTADTIAGAAALTAAINLAKRDEMAGKNIVVILPDSIERYLSDPYFNDEQVESQD